MYIYIYILYISLEKMTVGLRMCEGIRSVCSGSVVVTTLDSGPGGSWFESRVGAIFYEARSTAQGLPEPSSLWG